MKPIKPTFQLLFTPERFIRKATAHGLSMEPEEEYQQLLKQYLNNDLPAERVKDLEKRPREQTQAIRKAFLGAFKLTLSAVMAALLSSVLFRICLGIPTAVMVSSIQIIAASLLLIATLALLGWEIQSWKGESLPEQVNRCLFRSLYWFGTFLLVLSVGWEVTAI